MRALEQCVFINKRSPDHPLHHTTSHLAQTPPRRFTNLPDACTNTCYLRKVREHVQHVSIHCRCPCRRPCKRLCRRPPHRAHALLDLLLVSRKCCVSWGLMVELFDCLRSVGLRANHLRRSTEKQPGSGSG